MLPNEGFLTSSQAARRLGVCPDRVRQLAREGTLPAVITALGRFIPEQAVVELAQQRALRGLGVTLTPIGGAAA